MRVFQVFGVVLIFSVLSVDANGLHHNRRRHKKDDDSGLNELLETIFGAYHKELVPKRPTTVKLDLVLIKVKSTNEREGVFESVVTLLMEWQDQRLSWNPEENVTVLAVDSDKVWLPDIAMVNSADHLYAISKDTRFVVRVSNDGTMKFFPTGTARTWCELKLLTFPFDKQTCSYEFESWSMDSSTMTINQSSSAVVEDSFSSPQWALCSYSSIVYDHYYDFSGEVFTRLRFDFVVRRKTTFYLINLIFPCATLSMIQLMVFLIPSTDSTSDRISFGTTNLLTLVVFQTIVTEEMPKSSDSVTALSKYIIALIVVSAVGILEAVAAERLLRARCTAPPSWIMKIVRKLPLLWESQLPSGIGGMLLQQWSTGKCMSRGRSLAPLQNNKSNQQQQQLFGPSLTLNALLTEDSEPRFDCFHRKKKYYKSFVVRMALNKHQMEMSESFCQGTLRHSPSPVFGAQAVPPARMVTFEPVTDISPEPTPITGESPTKAATKSPSADIIEIGKMWGALVTQLDSLTFLCCAVCVFLLPLLFFVPLAMDEEKCQ